MDVQLANVLNMYADDVVELHQKAECVNREFWHQRQASWAAPPDADATLLELPASVSYWNSQESKLLWEAKDALLVVTARDGHWQVKAYAKTAARARSALDDARGMIPAYEPDDPGTVPVRFWTATPDGAREILRDVDAQAWQEVAANYPQVVGLENLMASTFRPGVGGQLLLWHGPPGAGKTTALRALAREWRAWCDLHYVVDPEVFFGARADYMLHVLTSSTDQDKQLEGPALAARWKLIVLEDCGEMLQRDAKREVGQALARLLNACDGLIGRGLRILVLITTNEDSSQLHEAISRPGRCAAELEFGPLDREQVRDWLAAHGHQVTAPGHSTLAELYGLVSDFGQRPARRPVGFQP